MIEWLNEGLTKGQFLLFVAGLAIGFLMVQAFTAILRKTQSTCNGFCGEYECKENQDGCKRKAQEK